MVTRWLHLEMLGGDPWILPIWASANDAVREGRTRPLTDELGQLGLHISIHLDILPRIAQRIIRETSELYGEARKHGPEHVFTRTTQAYAFRVDDDLKFRLIADIDALLYEVNSCWELMRKLFRMIRAHVGRPVGDTRTDLTDELREALRSRGVTDEVFRLLDRHRNFVAHEGTPDLAIDISVDGAWELLVMKETPISFDDPEDFFRYSELVAIARGFVGAKEALQEHLKELFRQAGAQQP